MSDQTSFQNWLDLCTQASIKQGNDVQSSQAQGSGDEVATRLRQEARLHFNSLSSSKPPQPSSPSNSSSVEQDISNASSATPNGALAILVSSLKPAFDSSSNVDAKVRALRCLMGALEGSTSLTHGVRQAVGQFLVELCRPESIDEESDDEDMADINMNQPMDYVDAENLTPEEITQKLQAMEQAHNEKRNKSSAKRSKKSSAGYVQDDVRDAAMAGLEALLRSQLDIFPTTRSQPPRNNGSSPLKEASKVVIESMELRVDLAMSGVRFRCQTSDGSNSSNGDSGMWGGAGAGYETTNPDMNIEDGLSKLPRQKRSICFNLFDGALDGLNVDSNKWIDLQSRSKDGGYHTTPLSLLKSMSTFASLASSCMHGETDPRCLSQLLHLLNKVQRVMMPLFATIKGNSNGNADQMDIGTTKADTSVFPSIEIFDAVGPYYPVHFTPPKNDPHGITRELLQDALTAVLCERGAIYKSQIHEKKVSGEDREEEETMITLATRMFLERLEPPKSSDYDAPSNGAESETEDKLAAVQDLTTLLLPQKSSSKNGAKAVDNIAAGPIYSPNVTRTTPALMSELSSSMARVHEEAVSSDAHSLASAIRKFSSSLAHSLEPATKSNSDQVDTTPLWEAYVVDILRHLSPILGSAPQGMHGRASTAYLASLAAEGGLKTLTTILHGCYPRFIGVLSLLEKKDVNKDVESQTTKQKSRDEEKLAAAMRGVAALVSSSRVALQEYERENNGVHVHPHPLASYIPATIQKIASVLNEQSEKDEAGPLTLAAVGALESVLTSADFSGLEEEDIVSLETMFSLMLQDLLCEERHNPKSNEEWMAACARVVGAVIALGLGENEGSDNNSVKSCGRLNAMANSLLPKILSSATSPHQNSSKSRAIRYDWMVLARASVNGSSQVSQLIVPSLISDTIGSLNDPQMDPRAPAMTLAYLIRHGGPNVGTAFHGLSSPGSTPFDVIRVLCSEGDSGDNEGQVATRQLQAGLSMLQLPESRAKDEEIANDTVKRAYSILPYLIPAYESHSSISSCGELINFVDQILPPLSREDEVKLCIICPLLAATLNSSSQVWASLESDTVKTLESMANYLAEFVVSTDHDSSSRSAAASCLFFILSHSSQDDDCDAGNHAVHKLLKEVVHPALSDALTCLKKELSETTNPRSSGSLVTVSNGFRRVEDALNFMSLLGSAAAIKGGTLSQTADKVAIFLAELACTGTSLFPFTEATVQLASTSEQGQRHPIMDPTSHPYILPASAFGSMLSVYNGGPFWRQRMTHKTLPVVMKALRTQARSQNPPALGNLTVVCHMICCLPVTLIGKSNLQQILPTMVAALVYFSKNLKDLSPSEIISTKPTAVLSTILAALAKILTKFPEDVSKFIGVIIPSLLLLSSPSGQAESYIPKQLLVFQCLEIITSLSNARNAILRERDQVVAVLSAVLDHPSMIIRNSVVQVRNVWYTFQ